jgi:Ulp1 family protease
MNICYVLSIRFAGKMQKCINNNVSGYKGVKKWAKLYFRGCSTLMKIMVVPFANHGHWSVFILDDIMTLHLDYMHAIHKQDAIKCFVRAICLCWAWCKRYTKVSTCFPISWVSKL